MMVDTILREAKEVKVEEVMDTEVEVTTIILLKHQPLSTKMSIVAMVDTEVVVMAAVGMEEEVMEEEATVVMAAVAMEEEVMAEVAMEEEVMAAVAMEEVATVVTEEEVMEEVAMEEEVMVEVAMEEEATVVTEEEVMAEVAMEVEAKAEKMRAKVRSLTRISALPWAAAIGIMLMSCVCPMSVKKIVQVVAVEAAAAAEAAAVITPKEVKV